MSGWCGPALSVPRLSPNVERYREASALYAELGTLQAVADHYGVTRERVRRLINNAERHGVAVRIPQDKKRERRQRTAADRRARIDAAIARHEKPYLDLIAIARRLGHVPRGTWLFKNEHTLYAALHRYYGVKNAIQKAVAETGLPLAPHGSLGVRRKRKPPSAATRARMSAAQRRRWGNRA